MAAAAPHVRMACPAEQQQHQKSNPDGDDSGTSENLKNGTAGFDESDDSSSRGSSSMVVKNRANNRESSGAEPPPPFQDGGGPPHQAPQQQPPSSQQLQHQTSNSNNSSGGPRNSDYVSLERRTNSDYQAYNQSTGPSSRDSNPMANDDFRGPVPQQGQEHPYNHGCHDMSGPYGRTGTPYDPQQSSQGGPSDVNSNSQTPNKMYPQYNQPQMRPGYPRHVGPPPHSQQRGGYPPMNNASSSGSNSTSQQQQQRFLSGPSLAQQTGPTPTLNQLLQAPNPLQRYHNSYDYTSSQGMHKGMGGEASQYQQGPNSSWGGMRTQSGYPTSQPQPMASSMYRNQGGPMSDPSTKRPYSSGQMSSPSPQGSQYPPGSHQPPQSQQQYHHSPYSSHQPPQQQAPQQPGQGPVIRPSMGQGYPQQGIQQYPQTPPHTQGTAAYDQAHPRQPSMSHHQQPQQQYGTHQAHLQQSQHHPTLPSPQQQSLQQQQPPSQQPPPPQQQTSPMPQQQPLSQTPPQQQSTQQQQPPQQQQQQQPLQTSSQDTTAGGSGNTSGGNSSGEDGPSGTASDVLPSSTGSGGSTTPGLRTPTTPPHPVVSPHRPVPSPSGPSSVGSPSLSPALGQQQNIPMPPRPSSSHSENTGPGQISQPPMAAQGYNQQMAPPAVYGNKMHQGMISGSGSHMGLYPPQPSSHYTQGSYHRPPNSAGIQGFSSQSQSSYPNPASGPTYPSQSPMPSHRMPNHPGAGPPSYNTSSTPGNYPNAQYSGSSSSSGGSPSPAAGYGMNNNMMPPPNQYPKASAMPPPTGGAQAAAQAAVMAAAASSSQTRQSPMYLRQHLQQKMYSGGYGSSSMSPVPPGAPGSGVPMCSDSTPMLPPSSTPSSQPMGITQASSMPPQSSTPGAMASGSSCDNSMALAGFTQTSAPSLGPPSTTITQSISSPVPTAVTVSSPSVMGSDMMQQGRGGMSGAPQGPPPPPIMDEGSQASNASASSSLPEERVETPKPNNKPAMSHPPTPNTLSSPGAASMSSFHDEFESVSSPSWPRTPASPVINNQTYDHHPIKRPDGMLKLYDMSDDPERRVFLDKLIMYNEERGTPISQCPTISKQPLDLFRLYMSCKERGGFVEVMKGKMWKDIAGLIGIGASSSAAYTLRKQYIKHLLPFECKYDRGGIDPGPLISSLESNSRKKNAAKNAIMANQEGYHQGGPMMDGYSTPYPGAYPPSSGPHPGMMPNAEYPGHHAPYNDPMHPGGPMVNHSGSEGTIDPFSDDMPASQYPQRHSSSDGYGYTQSATNSGMPAYSGNQSNMPPSGQYGYNNPPVAQQEPYGDQYPSNAGPPSSETSYGNRSMVPDPYVPPGGYPPNRTVGPTNPPQYPPYQGPCDQDRYEQPASQTPMMRPPASSGMGPGPSIQQDPSNYPPHRYPNQPMAAREGMTPQQMGSYQGRPPMPQSQYPGPNNQAAGQTQYPQSQQDSYRGPDYPPQMSRLQSTLIQRLQPKNHTLQNYPGNQQGMYGQSMPPPNKVAPQGNVPGGMYQRDMYSMGPKRHGDFSKPHPAQDQYHMGSYTQQQSQGPYSDRSQYPYRPSHGVPPPSGPPQPGWGRDGRPYPSGPNQYQPGHRDGWDMSRHDGPQPGNQGNWPRYGGPQQDPYSGHMGPKMGYNRGYMSPNKMQPHSGVGQPPQYGPAGGRKEIIFPPDSVEAVSPVMTKRRRVQSKDMTSVDPWRLMMALKSGLLCESTWALDVLSVLICDDATVLYFGLSHLPGLLEVLMDHYRRSLNLIFELAGELEVGFTASALPDEDLKPKKPSERKWYELDKDYPVVEHWEDHSEDVLRGDNQLVLDSPNYTQKTRCRKLVKEKPEEALFLFDPYKKWDIYEGPSSDGDQWQYGIGEAANYVQTHFENDERGVRFARIMENVKNPHSKRRDVEGDGISNKILVIDSKKCFKRDCNSDTEEDESLFASSPTSRTETKNCQNATDEIPEDERKIDAAEITTEVNGDEIDNVEATVAISEIKNEVDIKEELKLHIETKENGKVEATCPDVFPKIRLSSPNRKRRSQDDLEDESYNRDEPSLCVTTDSQDSLARRCICISSLLRNFSFVPGNDTEMSKNSGFLMVMARLLLLHHVHSQRKPPQRHYDREEDSENTSIADSCSSLNCDYEWWWDMLHMLRENTLVTLANISGQLDLAPFPEEISFPLLDGLMHWVTCPSSYAQDPLPTQPSQSVLSPQRLSLEALCKLSVLESNVDLMMATPPWQRIDRFFSLLAKWLSRNEDQVLREFSVVLLSNLSQADSAMARAIALQGACIPLLITFVEQAEQSALQVANSQGINALRENPELMGTTLDMVRRSAGTLRCLARVPTNRTLFLQHQQRLLALVMSQILDQGVASIIADVLYECSQQDDLDDFIITPLIEEKLSSTPSPAT